MATLQTIRSKGPLLVIVIGLALFAFIAGDAWKILQPHQGKQDVGEVNGKELSAQDFQKMVDEYSEVIKMTNGLNSLTDEQLTNIKDQVWQSYVNNQLIAAEAEKLGLTVTDAEIKAIIDQGTHPLLMQTPFRNPQTGAFDKDMLKKFLVDYANLNSSQMPAQYVEYYQKMGNLWNFIEKTLRESTLAEKYQNLISKSLISNPVSAEDAFKGRTEQSAFQGIDLVAVSPDSQGGAGQDGLAVHQYGAQTAVGGVAAPLHGKTTLIPQEVQQNRIRFHRGNDSSAVEFQLDLHITYLPACS